MQTMEQRKDFSEFVIEPLEEVISPLSQQTADWVTYASLALNAISTGAMVAWGVAAFT